MKEDPLFDPWSTGEPEEGPAVERPAKWRSPVGSPGWPTTLPTEEVADEGSATIGQRSSGMFGPGPLAAAPVSRPAPLPTRGPLQPPTAGPSLPVTKTPSNPTARPGIDSRSTVPQSRQAARRVPVGVDVFRQLLLPRLTDARQRLEMARHETTLDDRLDQPEPSVRFKVQPRPGPFEEAPQSGSVLEIRLEGGQAPEVVGRLWMDPLATGPGEEVRVHPDRLAAAWIDSLLLDFIEKTLRLG